MVHFLFWRLRVGAITGVQRPSWRHIQTAPSEKRWRYRRLTHPFQRWGTL
ncbi:hypothetical protein PROVRUST_04949 [Providencia rustigianii DSM 4541]|uniref:Uncharacterized protein n=1 Tax=Providencia rustigianii DSM 4541 TaxID=500637 RepID=D1NYX8_9GAMM|nr:hypothetical protein PROVRUST_04949 [Providencia rustigianii DSM 4541]